MVPGIDHAAGHAIEARVYAEDPAQNFLPQAGRVLLYREPTMPGVRIDSGIAEETVVPVHYDPLLAKVIASGETRELARARLAAALRDFPILGIRTNVPFLLSVLEHPRFQAAEIDTSFLDTEGAAIAGLTRTEPPPFVLAAMAAAGAEAAGSGETTRDAWDPWLRLRGWRA